MGLVQCLLLMLGFVLSAAVYGQSTVTGKVTDDKGNPIQGASIIEKGTRNGARAGADGSFTMKIKPGASLVVSAIGFQDKTIKAGTSGILSISLATDVASLTDVVVTGVGSATTKKKLGIAVQSITADKLPAAPTASIDQALVGKIPGAQISSISGNPGDPVNILLRGINTVQGGTKPLILVDGVEVHATDINSLDLSNVDRIEVVQGAASSTLYGAQGANGVIQVFTKKGKQGAVAINFSTSYSTNEYVNNGNVHKATLHPYLTDANGNFIRAVGSLTPLTYDSVGNLPGVVYTYGGGARAGIWDPRNNANQPYNGNIHYYDQFKEVFQTGSTLNNIINISGASEKSDYAISISNNHTISPVLKNGYVDRTNLTANLGTELFKGFKIRSVTQLIYTKNTLQPGIGAAGGDGYGTGNQQGSVGQIYGFLNTSPFFDLKFKTANASTIYGYANTPGSYVNHVLGGDAGYLSVNSSNPFYNSEYTAALDNKIDIVQSFDANYRVNKFVELDSKYGLNFRTENPLWTFYNQSHNANSNYYQSWASYENGNDNGGELDNFQYNTTFQNFLASATIRTDFQNRPLS